MRRAWCSTAERRLVMATTGPKHSPKRTPAGGPSPLFGVFLILWLAFAAALIFNQGALDAVWTWLNALPLVIRVIAWVLFLPIALGLWVWTSEWVLWLRITLVIIIAVANLATLSPKPQEDRGAESTSSESRAGGGEIPPGSVGI
jgi:hypothetical protein